jgi:hypothetical protein
VAPLRFLHHQHAQSPNGFQVSALLLHQMYALKPVPESTSAPVNVFQIKCNNVYQQLVDGAHGVNTQPAAVKA